MKKKLLLASALVSLMGTTAQAQSPIANHSKFDGISQILLQKEKNMAVRSKAVNNQSEMKSFIISTTDAESVVEAIQLKGYEATFINNTVVSATFPVDYLMELSQMEEVTYINGARKLKPTMHTARKAIGVDKIHNGTDLETPFTGKGVIVGVIDQGFQYQHIAFMDENKKPRVKAVWNHYGNKQPTENIPSTGDNIPASGHGTHVTNIAAGSKVKSNDYYGIAYNADIIMVPSKFSDANIIKEATYIKEYAQKAGKPFVINMSFGSHMGPHDGTGSYCDAMNAISQPGGILVAAMGNEGNFNIHSHHEFTKNNEKVYLILQPSMTNYSMLDLWEQTADNKAHLKVKPIVFTKSGKKKDYKNNMFWNSCSYSSSQINPFNKKENFNFQFSYSVPNDVDGRKTFFGLEIEGNPGDEFHAWINDPSEGTFAKVFGGTEYPQADDDYCVGEGAATIPYAIAVGSFNSNSGTFVSAIDGLTYFSGGNSRSEGDISSYSSHGPFLGSEPKPTVSAPGSNILSAISRYGSDFDAKNHDIVDIIKDGINKHYYASMSGTSMASPAVTGTVALWLEANPELDYKQVKEIIQKTSKLDRFTGTKEEWTPTAGYGKIDAYEGLKMALKMAENTGIYDQLNSETPVTIQKGYNAFQILFNNDESYANIAVYNASGVQVKNETLTDVRRGDETSISTAGLPAGVYVVNINTTASSASKKMLVK